ncbi:hypothetical protein OC846_002874 [Tilletia horrida]|uniref:Uncharacterized protein n=1 Tax=Tilletia horrida TaxID=155126 RepID=A0AAN6GT78_9BASI|nr:hypothetical protein OC845_002069 [Tilletia horrida]KAK0552470.1 hypothetical protein OC846_002874 [Tilletia horrida]KAK0570160.1 hypothetical protein OC861_000109 [Tilletia horrida]
MSRAAKTTFLLSAAVSTLVVVGVHYQQSAERETMYQGVIRDQARLDAKRRAAAAEQEGSDSISAPLTNQGSGVKAPPLPPSQLTPEARYEDWRRNRDREEAFQRVQPTKAYLERQQQQQQGGNQDSAFSTRI